MQNQQDKPVENKNLTLWERLFGGEKKPEQKPKQSLTQQQQMMSPPMQQQKKKQQQQMMSPPMQQQKKKQQQMMSPPMQQVQSQQQKPKQQVQSQQQKPKQQQMLPAPPVQSKQQTMNQVSTSLSDPEFHDAMEQKAADAAQMAQQNVQQAHDQYAQAQKEQAKAEKNLGTQIKQSDGEIDENLLQQAYDTHVSQKQTEKAKRALQQAIKKSSQIEGILQEIRALKQETVKHMQQQKKKTASQPVQASGGYDFTANPNNEFLHIKRPNQQITYGRKNDPEGKRFNNIPRMVFPKEVFMSSTTPGQEFYLD